MGVEGGIVQLSDVHRGHAVNRGGAFPFDRIERCPGMERLGRNDHRRAVHHSRKRAQHAAEAMVEGHRDADPVGVGKILTLADVERIQEQVAVAEHRGLGKSRRAGGVLNVDRQIGVLRAGDLIQSLGGHGLGPVANWLQVIPPGGPRAQAPRPSVNGGNVLAIGPAGRRPARDKPRPASAK